MLRPSRASALRLHCSCTTPAPTLCRNVRALPRSSREPRSSPRRAPATSSSGACPTPQRHARTLLPEQAAQHAVHAPRAHVPSRFKLSASRTNSQLGNPQHPASTMRRRCCLSSLLRTAVRRTAHRAHHMPRASRAAAPPIAPERQLHASRARSVLARRARALAPLVAPKQQLSSPAACWQSGRSAACWLSHSLSRTPQACPHTSARCDRPQHARAALQQREPQAHSDAHQHPASPAHAPAPRAAAAA